MIDYYQNKRQEERRSRKHKIAAVFLTILTIAVLSGLFWVMHNQISQIKNLSVNINGPEGDLKNDIGRIYYDVLQNGVFSKVFGNDKNILLADVYESGIISAIQKQFPIINNLSIRTDILKRSVSVDASVRQRYGIWCFDRNASPDATSTSDLSPDCYWFDPSGVVFDSAPSTEGELINKVVDSSDLAVALGGRVLPADESGNIVAMFDLMEKVGFPYRTLYLKDRNLEEISSSDSVTPVFRFSLMNNPSYALRALQDLGSDLKKASYIDLRISNRIYYR